MSDDPLYDATVRAAQAEALLRNELLTEAFNTLDAEYIKAWRLTHIKDTEARERLHQAVQIVAKVKDHLSAVITDGKLAQAEINVMADPKAKKTHFERV